MLRSSKTLVQGPNHCTILREQICYTVEIHIGSGNKKHVSFGVFKLYIIYAEARSALLDGELAMA